MVSFQAQLGELLLKLICYASAASPRSVTCDTRQLYQESITALQQLLKASTFSVLISGTVTPGSGICRILKPSS